MVFDVLITDKAYADLDAIAGSIKRNSSFEAARKWFAAIVGTIETLSEMPGRLPLAPESEALDAEVRMLLYGKRNRRYKIYCAIHPDLETVRVFHIRHWARKPPNADELTELMENGGEENLE